VTKRECLNSRHLPLETATVKKYAYPPILYTKLKFLPSTPKQLNIILYILYSTLFFKMAQETLLIHLSLFGFG